jgi:hypothetical protein
VHYISEYIKLDRNLCQVFLFCRYEDHPSEKTAEAAESKTEVKKEK